MTNVHCIHLLVDASKELTRRTGDIYITYSEVSYAAFQSSSSIRINKLALAARKVTDICLCFTHLGFCCTYFLFISQNMKQVPFIIKKSISEFSIFQIFISFGDYDYRIYMLIFLLPVLLLCMIRNLKNLSPVFLGKV